MTQVLLQVMQDHLTSNEDYMKECLINSRSISEVDLHIISQIKGQILTYRQLLNMKEYLSDEEINRVLEGDNEREDSRT